MSEPVVLALLQLLRDLVTSVSSALVLAGTPFLIRYLWRRRHQTSDVIELAQQASASSSGAEINSQTLIDNQQIVMREMRDLRLELKQERGRIDDIEATLPRPEVQRRVAAHRMQNPPEQETPPWLTPPPAPPPPRPPQP